MALLDTFKLPGQLGLSLVILSVELLYNYRDIGLTKNEPISDQSSRDRLFLSKMSYLQNYITKKCRILQNY